MRNNIFILIIPILVACISSPATPTMSINDIVATSIIQTQAAEVPPTNQSAEVTPINMEINQNNIVNDEEIYNYMQSIWDAYESKNSINTAEALVFIDTSDHYKVPLLQVFRIFMKQDSKAVRGKEETLTDAELDVLAINRFSQIGFIENNGNWFYKDKSVNMGIQLPVPDNMKPKEPDQGKEINVSMKISSYEKNGDKLNIVISTNLPDGMELMLDLKGPNDYWSQDKQTVHNGKLESTFGKLGAGAYTLQVTSPTAKFQPDNRVKMLLGEKGKNMVGSLVQFDEIWGYTLEYVVTIDVK